MRELKKRTGLTKSVESGAGFTLIELLIVVFIMALISTMAVANYRKAEKQKRAVIGVDTVINAIRNAQNFTLAGKQTTNANPACRIPQYYVMTFSYASPAVLSALNNNPGTCGSSLDQIETYPLPVNTRIKAAGLTLDGASASTNLKLVFYPPFGNLKAARDGSSYNSFTTAQIIVETSDGAVSKTATVDGVAGRIGE